MCARTRPSDGGDRAILQGSQTRTRLVRESFGLVISYLESSRNSIGNWKGSGVECSTVLIWIFRAVPWSLGLILAWPLLLGVDAYQRYQADIPKEVPEEADPVSSTVIRAQAAVRDLARWLGRLGLVSLALLLIMRGAWTLSC